MKNRYAAFCFKCGEVVEPEEGHLAGKDKVTGHWQVSCPTCGPAWFDREANPGDDQAERIKARQAEREAEAKAEQRRLIDECLRRFREEVRRGPWVGEDPAIRPTRGAIPACLQLLGLFPPVDEATVKARFRELAKKHHPDRGGDPKRFIAIEGAYRQALRMAGRAS